jgi:hypothetical protein
VKTDTVFEMLKEWVTVANPGLVTQRDLARVEKRLEDLIKLVEKIEQRVEQRSVRADETHPPRPQ